MSNLLKKALDSEIVAFGFPMIETGAVCGGSDTAESRICGLDLELNSEESYRLRLLELERRTQEIEKEAYGKGFAQGEKDGYEYGSRAAQVVKTQLEKMVEEFEKLPARVFEDYRDWLVRTSIKIAGTLVKRELQTAPEIVADVAKSLLDEAEEHASLTLYLNPHDYEFLERNGNISLDGTRKHFVIKSDRKLKRGDCRVESDIQLLDASFENGLQSIEKHLLGRNKPGEVLKKESDE